MKREAKAKKGVYVEPEAKLLFVVRIRGINDMHPKVGVVVVYVYQMYQIKQHTLHHTEP